MNSDPDFHTSRRKILAPTFTHQQIMANEALITERIDVFIKRILLEESKCNYVDIWDFLGLLSVEIICKICFNTDFDSRPGFSHKFLYALEGGGLSIAITQVFPPLLHSRWSRRIPGGIGKAFRDLDDWKAMTAELVTDLKNQQWDEAILRKFNAGPLLVERNKVLSRHYTFSEVVEESMGLAIAGASVTQHTLTYLFWALSRSVNRSYQERLRYELRSSTHSPPTFSDVANLPYLNAVIKEAYRTYPAIMSTKPRILHAPLTVTGTGITLPPQTVVGMQNFVHHRNAEIFPEPERFVPERWLDGESKLTTDLASMNASITPFSTGAYNCIGQTLAKVEIYLAVSHIIQRFDLRLNSAMTDDDMFMQDAWAVLPKGSKLVLDITPIDKAVT